MKNKKIVIAGGSGQAMDQRGLRHDLPPRGRPAHG